MQVVAVESCDTHHDIAVAVDVFGDAVHDNVGTVIERVLNVGAQEGVVDNNEDAVLVGGGGDGTNVDETQGGVAGRLNPHQLCGLCDVLADVHLDLGREGDLDAVRLCD